MPSAPPTSDLDRQTKRSRRRLRRLEARLADARAQEQRRADRLEQARRDGRADEIRRRTRRLERTRAREALVAAKIAKLQGPAAGPSVEAYCLRDRTTVVMVAPTPTTMRNGRAAVTGTCPRCGGRLVRPVARDAALASG